jgi:hypothetical protein
VPVDATARQEALDDFFGPAFRPHHRMIELPELSG